MSDIHKAKSKRGQYHTKKNFRLRQFSLGINQKGFLCSCNNREKDCIKESYNLLNKYADLLYPAKESEVTTGDVSEDLASELATLKSQKSEMRRFQVVESGAKNFLFIRTTLDNPLEIVERIISDVSVNKVQQTKYLIRLIPIETTCKANVKDIEAAFEPLAEKYFKNQPTVFSIVMNHRNNNSISKENTIKAVAAVVAKTRPDHKVNLKGAEISVVIEVIKGIALIGVAPKFLQLKRFNLLSLSEEQVEEVKVAENEEDT